MPKHIKAARSVSSLPPRPPPHLELGGLDTSSSGRLTFPQLSRPIVTTKKGVFDWDENGLTEIFRSTTEGIVAAQVCGDTIVLAVADSQVIILHKIRGSRERNSCLKGAGVWCLHVQPFKSANISIQGQIRLLRYAQGSDRLFFTTTLRNIVQSYSMIDAKLSDTSHDHPTQPSTIAISCDARYMVSTSAAPPTIHISDLSVNMRPVLVLPDCSPSAVVASAFHPEIVSLFMLAFADGTVALFDALRFVRKLDTEQAYTAGYSGVVRPLAFMKDLHARGTATTQETLHEAVGSDGVDDGTGLVSIGNKSQSITAVAFVPGNITTAVTVGSDGRCFVVDFSHGANVLHAWHLRQPGTSVSVVSDGRPGIHGFFIAVGRQDGRVSIFDSEGWLLGQKTLNEGGAPVIDVEWTQVDLPPIPPPHDPATLMASPTTSVDSFQTAFSQVRSSVEGSTDTVLDWGGGV